MTKVLQQIIGTLAAISASVGIFFLGVSAKTLSAAVQAGDYKQLGLPTALILGAAALAVIYVLIGKALEE